MQIPKASRGLRLLAGFVAGLLVLLWRLTCRYKVIADPRPELRKNNRAYIYALLHAHQIAAVFVNDDRRMTAMVSRSADGDLLVPALHLRRVIPVRGSSQSRGIDKGGRRALQMQAEYLRQGIPALLAVDGPRGPRNCVHRGAADLAISTNTPILPVVVLGSRRWFLSRTWDRLQIPKPFCTIRLIFGEVIYPNNSQSPEELTKLIATSVNQLEENNDPLEAQNARQHRLSRGD